MKLILAFMFSLFLAWGVCKFSSSKLASALANEPPGWPITRSANFLPPPKIILTARSTSTTTKLPWEGSPRPSMPPSVTPSEGSSTSEGPGGIESPATTTEGSSTSEGAGGIESPATTTKGSSTSEGAGGIKSTATSTEESMTSEGLGRIQSKTPSSDGTLITESPGGTQTGRSSTFGSESVGFLKSESQSKTQNSTTPNSLRYFAIDNAIDKLCSAFNLNPSKRCYGIFAHTTHHHFLANNDQSLSQ